MSSSVILPKQMPVMPLPGALLFPHALLPLHIFELRYRQMLKHALTHHRMFCVALLKPYCVEWKSPSDFFHIAGAGLIRACVERRDGTSNLILQGLQRVRFSDFKQKTPFPIATIDSLESDSSSSVETEALAAKVLELYSNLKGDRRSRCLDVCKRSAPSPACPRRTLHQSAAAIGNSVSPGRNRKRSCIAVAASL